MREIRRWLGVAFVAFGLSAHAAPAEDAPERSVRTLVQTLRELHTSKEGALTPAKRKENAATSRRIDALLDLDGLAERVLGPSWQKLAPAERRRFSALLTELFHEVAYPSAAKFFGDLELEVQGAGEAPPLVLGPPDLEVVRTSLTHPDEGLVEVDFALAQVGGRWVVVDVVLDGVSLGLDIRSQMQEILAEDGYEELKRRIRKKVKDEGEG